MDLDPIFEQIAALRHPETGCPWDRAQTITGYLEPIEEEARELVDALRSGDPAQVREEAGDLLWNLCFAIRLAEETGALSREDVVRDVVRKMRGRHPHVFGNESAATPEEALRAFKRAKARQRKADSAGRQQSTDAGSTG